MFQAVIIDRLGGKTNKRNLYFIWILYLYKSYKEAAFQHMCLFLFSLESNF